MKPAFQKAVDVQRQGQCSVCKRAANGNHKCVDVRYVAVRAVRGMK